MHSFIINASNQTSVFQQIIESVSKLTGFKLSESDIQAENNPDIIVIKSDKSIGIDTVRELKEKLSLKAYRRQFKLAIVLQSERLTIPAQNAILKTLEEPTQNTFLFLHTTNSLLLLPTIRSRCQIIELMDKSRQKKMAEPIKNPLLGNPKMKIGQKIAAAKSIGSKDEALLLLNDLQSSSLENLRQDTQLFKLIQNIEEAKSAIKSNCHYKLIIENFIIKTQLS